jgi:hypothetical protein
METKYFEWKEKLFAQKNTGQFARLAFVIFTKVNEMELNDVTNNFLCKCYIDNLLVTKALLGNEGLEENTVRTLSVVRDARARLAKRLLERENDPAYASKMQSYRYFDKATFADMHRCSLHIKSCEFNDDGNKDKFIKNIDACLLHNPLKRVGIRGYRADQSSRIS